MTSGDVTAFERRPVVRVDSVVMGQHPKPVTIAEMATLLIEPLAQVCLLNPGVETL